MLNIEFQLYIDKVRKILLKSDSPDRDMLVRQSPVKIICPVCGVKIREAKYAGAMITVDGKKYYFRTYACKTKLIKDPEKYLANEISS